MASYPAQTYCVPTMACVTRPPNQSEHNIESAIKHRSIFFGVGITQIILGVFCLGLGIAAMPICNNGGCSYYVDDYGFYIYFGAWTMMATGIWGGALVIVFGSFCLAQAYDPSGCKITTNLILSVFGIVISLAMTGIEIGAAVASFHTVSLVVIHSLMCTFSFVLFVLFMVSTTYAGLAHRCCGSCQGCCYGSEELLIPGPASQQYVTLADGRIAWVQGPPQGNSQAVLATPLANTPPQYSLTSPSAQPNVIGSLGPSGGVVNQGYPNDNQVKM